MKVQGYLTRADLNAYYNLVSPRRFDQVSLLRGPKETVKSADGTKLDTIDEDEECEDEEEDGEYGGDTTAENVKGDT